MEYCLETLDDRLHRSLSSAEAISRFRSSPLNMAFVPQYGDAGIKPLRNQWHGDTANATLELDWESMLEMVEDIIKGLNYIHAGGCA